MKIIETVQSFAFFCLGLGIGNMFFKHYELAGYLVFAAAILAVICYIAERLHKGDTEEIPECFGKPLCYHNMAENGCYDCLFAKRCDAARKRHLEEGT